MRLMHPFVKWVGGKTQLLDEIVQHIPDTTEVYVEPFVGGGAVLFEVLEKKPNISIVIINDKNVNLINAYYAVVYFNKELLGCLASISHDFVFAEDKKKFYYEQRKLYNDWCNEYITSSQDEEIDTNNFRPYGADIIVPQAARFMFLNKTGFNGLYRVNKKGEFNVPYNGATTVSFDYENLEYISYKLQNMITIIIDGDYNQEEIVNLMKKDLNPERIFFYLDPPYRPLRKDCLEVKYTDNGFDDSEQERLKEFCDFLNERGIKFIESNSDPEDKYFDELYKDYHIKRVQARRNINSVASKRGKINEILISNFDIQ